MLKRTTTFILAFTLTLSLGSTVFAAPTVDSLTKQKQQLEQQQKSLNQSLQNTQTNFSDAQKQLDNLEIQIEDLDNKIEGLNNNINDTNAKISAKENEIKDNQAKLEKATADMEAEQALFNQRMRSMYISGPTSYLDVLLSSNNLTDFYSKVQDIVLIAKYDQNVIKDLNDTKELINQTETSLEKDKTTLLSYQQSNENQLAQLQSSKSDQQNLISQVKSKQAAYASQISDYQAQIQASNKQVQDTENQLAALAAAAAANANNSSNSSTIASSASANAIIAYAYQFMGTPYVWGGTTPVPGFDCSGFMQYVYAHFGIQLTRTTYTQINEGTPVSRDQLQPGDLIFFGTYDDPHHVGMYVGNNCFIHAPHTGDVIKISSLDGMDYLCARRILH